MGRVSFTASAPVLFAPLLSSGSNLLCSRPSALQACSVSPGVACFPFLLLSSGVCWVPDPFCCYHFLQFLADSYLCASCYVCGICSLCRCPLPSSAPHACTVPPPLTGSLDSPKRLSLGGLPLRHILGDCLLLQFVRSLREEADRRPGRLEDPKGCTRRSEAPGDSGVLRRVTRFTPIYDLNSY
ncbi:uncharacterized protein LOC120640442 isoform X6 [Panicum virgatum]|uniref:uncharacterized protein LOC120640442 isoform X6 n=1 Tax=Panicum virgatum TaxID=38727 RepID=UPI0019D5D5E9|nr:uncharacterized protein LOC120640442 isoform X6 [Panicum virgatum]